MEDWAHSPDSNYLQMPKEDASELSKVDVSIKTGATFKERFNYYVYSRQIGSWASQVTGWSRENDAKDLQMFSPIKNIKANFPPTLLVHGDQDTDVPFYESVKLRKVFVERKIDHQFIAMEGYGHVFDIMEGGMENEDIAKVFAAIDSFLKQY